VGKVAKVLLVAVLMVTASPLGLASSASANGVAHTLPANDRMYLLSCDDTSAVGSTGLYSVDSSTGFLTLIRSLPNTDIGIQPGFMSCWQPGLYNPDDGYFYVSNFQQDTKVYKIKADTGDTELVVDFGGDGNVGFNSVGSLALSPTGTVYASDGDELYVLDFSQDPPTRTFVAEFQDLNANSVEADGAFAFAPDGKLYGTGVYENEDEDEVLGRFEFNPQTALATLIVTNEEVLDKESASFDSSGAAWYIERIDGRMGVALGSLRTYPTFSPGVSSEFTFRLNDANGDMVHSQSLIVIPGDDDNPDEDVVEYDLVLDAVVGDQSSGATTTYSAQGLKSGSDWELVLRSTPQTIASGVVTDTGIIGGEAIIPDGLEPGWHSITLTGTDIKDQAVESVVWFKIDAAGIITEISVAQPKLASTGADIQPLIASGLLAVIAGAGLLTFGRRKRSA
jgi:LPXTG-motif cell wall-anchored protein